MNKIDKDAREKHQAVIEQAEREIHGEWHAIQPETGYALIATAKALLAAGGETEQADYLLPWGNRVTKSYADRKHPGVRLTFSPLPRADGSAS